MWGLWSSKRHAQDFLAIVWVFVVRASPGIKHVIRMPKTSTFYTQEVEVLIT